MGKFLSVLSLILGFLSILCSYSEFLGLVLALLGLACGIAGVAKLCSAPPVSMIKRLKNVAMAGIAISVLGLSLGVAVNVLFLLGLL